jgi:SWI/SNF-related matrix-associated actin-dependent regulator of chromatin subfamily A member 5
MQRFWYKRLLTRLDKGLLEGVFQNSKDKVMEASKENGSGHECVVQDQELEAIQEDQWGETRKFVEQAVEESKTDGKWRKLMNLLMQLRKVYYIYMSPARGELFV